MSGIIWRDIKNFEGRYQVSNTGLVKSLGNSKTRKDKILKPGKNKDGYLHLILQVNKIHYRFRVHRLVASAFIHNDSPSIKVYVNHKDNNPSNNHVDNLEWVTQSENSNHYHRRYWMSNDQLNERAEQFKIKYNNLLSEVNKFPSKKEAAIQLGIPRNTLFWRLKRYKEGFARLVEACS